MVVVVVSCVIGVLSSFKLKRKAFHLVYVVLFDLSVAHALKDSAARLIGLADARGSLMRLYNARSRLDADFISLGHASELPRRRSSWWAWGSCVSFDWDLRRLATALNFATDLLDRVVVLHKIRQISFRILHLRSDTVHRGVVSVGTDFQTPGIERNGFNSVVPMECRLPRLPGGFPLGLHLLRRQLQMTVLGVVRALLLAEYWLCGRYRA